MSRPVSVAKDQCESFLANLGTLEAHAIVLLLCAPTEVLMAWRDPGGDFIAACRNSGLSDDAISAADRLRLAIEGREAQEEFFAVATTLRILAYGCVEPHPDRANTQEVIRRLQ